MPIFAQTMNKLYELENYYLNGNTYALDPYNDSWDHLPEGVLRLKVCTDEEGNFCKANKYCRQSKYELFSKEFEPPECSSVN